MSARTLLPALLVAVALVTSPLVARADDASDLAKARAAYESKSFEDAEHRLRGMLDPETGTMKDASLRSRARMYWGATMLSLGRPDEAAGIFESLLLDDPGFEPDPLSFPGAVLDAVIDTRKRIIDKINQAKAEQVRLAAERKAREEEEKRKAVAHLRLVEKLAAEESITEKHSRWVALLPFGAGQFQNGQPLLGGILAGAEGAALLGAVIAFPFWYYNRAKVNDLSGLQFDPRVDPLKTYIDRANVAQNVNVALDVAFLAVAVVGAVQAEVTFVPEKKEIKPRKVEALVPSFSPREGGGVFGLGGRF